MRKYGIVRNKYQTFFNVQKSTGKILATLKQSWFYIKIK